MVSFSKIPYLSQILRVDNLVDIEVSGINVEDYPDFCDAYISSACLIVGPFKLVLSDTDLSHITDMNPEYVRDLALDSCVEY